jgi:secreted trypsin-like serine protease
VALPLASTWTLPAYASQYVAPPNGTIARRVTDGVVVPSDAIYPYATQLTIAHSGGSYRCGGTLISANTVLTAAHCLCNQGSNSAQLPPDGSMTITAMVGHISPSNAPGQTNTFQVAQAACVFPSQLAGRDCGYLRHPDYTGDMGRFISADLGLIFLPGSVPSGRSAWLDAYNTSNSAGFRTGTAITMGWGLTNPGDTRSLSPSLQVAEVKPIPYAECASLMGAGLVIESEHICALGTKMGADGLYSDSCSGDSGGPLLMESPDYDGIADQSRLNAAAVYANPDEAAQAYIMQHNAQKDVRTRRPCPPSSAQRL